MSNARFPTLSPVGRGLSAAILRAKLRKSHGGKGEGEPACDLCNPLTRAVAGNGDSATSPRWGEGISKPLSDVVLQ